MNVLSLFDGMSAGMLALQRAGIPVNNYYASEIDKHCITVSKDNWPSIVHVGDVTRIVYSGGRLFTQVGIFEVKIDLLIGGSPCQSLSNLGDGSGLNGKSGLFYHFLRIRDEIRAENPNLKYMLENVVGMRDSISTISAEIGTEPTMIDSSLVSGQMRKRYYWTNIEGVTQPEDKGIKLKDILELKPHESAIIKDSRIDWLLTSETAERMLRKRYAAIDPEQALCLTARSEPSWNCNYVTRNGKVTKLSVIEYERLQTLPDNYTKAVSDTQRYKMIGNGWTVDVIAHILKNLKGTND
jgi:site-specific DNA-cytosine methylase